MTCPTCAVLRRERDEALERGRQLEQAAAGDNLTAVLGLRLGLANMPAKLLAILMELEVATKKRVFDTLYFDDPNGGPSPKIMDIMISKLRRKLRPHGIEIVTQWGSGWSLSPEMKAKVRELIGGGS